MITARSTAVALWLMVGVACGAAATAQPGLHLLAMLVVAALAALAAFWPRAVWYVKLTADAQVCGRSSCSHQQLNETVAYNANGFFPDAMGRTEASDPNVMLCPRLGCIWSDYTPGGGIAGFALGTDGALNYSASGGLASARPGDYTNLGVGLAHGYFLGRSSNTDIAPCPRRSLRVCPTCKHHLRAYFSTAEYARLDHECPDALYLRAEPWLCLACALPGADVARIAYGYMVALGFAVVGLLGAAGCCCCVRPAARKRRA
jgi:hypothetical protein